MSERTDAAQDRKDAAADAAQDRKDAAQERKDAAHDKKEAAAHAPTPYAALRDMLRATVDQMLLCTDDDATKALVTEGGILLEDGNMEQGWSHLGAAMRAIGVEQVRAANVAAPTA